MLFIFCIYSSNPSEPPSANNSGVGEDDEDSVQNHKIEKEKKKKVDVTEDENRKLKKKKRDVKPKSDVTDDEKGTPKKKKRDVKPKSDVTEDEKGTPKNKKCDVKPKSDVKEDEKGKLENKKRDVKNTNDEKGTPKNKKRDVKPASDVNNDSDEDLVIKRSKTSVVSLRRSAHQQQNRNAIQNKLSQLKKQRSKELAGPFILDKSDVTFRPPHGFYGHFGMTETLNEDQSKTCDAANEEEEEEEDARETSSSLEAIVITKPIEGFLDNELFSDDNMDITDDTLKNNINSIASLKEEDIEVYEIMNDSSNGNKTDTKEDEDCSGNRYIKSSSGNRYIKSSEESDVNSEDPDAYRIDNTPGFLDNRWRIKNHAYPVDNRGFGCHKKTLEEMENTGNEKDQELLQVLSDVTSTVSRQACEEDDEEGDNDEEGDSGEEGDSDNGCETCGYISRDYSDEGNDGDRTPTSEYGSAKEEITNRSHNSDTGDNSIVQKEGDGATVPEKKECDITDNDGGGKSEVDEALQKRDVNATAPADQKERDVTEHEKRGVDE